MNAENFLDVKSAMGFRDYGKLLFAEGQPEAEIKVYSEVIKLQEGEDNALHFRAGYFDARSDEIAKDLLNGLDIKMTKSQRAALKRFLDRKIGWESRDKLKFEVRKCDSGKLSVRFERYPGTYAWEAFYIFIGKRGGFSCYNDEKWTRGEEALWACKIFSFSDLLS